MDFQVPRLNKRAGGFCCIEMIKNCRGLNLGLQRVFRLDQATFKGIEKKEQLQRYGHSRIRLIGGYLPYILGLFFRHKFHGNIPRKYGLEYGTTYLD